MHMKRRLPKFESVLKYLLSTILIGVCLYPKFPFVRIPSTFVSIRLEDVLLALSFILFCIYLFTSGKYKQILNNNLTKGIILYLAVGFLSVLSSIAITNSASVHISLLHWMRRIEYFTPFFMGLYLIRHDKSLLNYYFKVILIVLVLIFFYGLGQRYFNWPIIITQNEEYSKGVALRWIAGSHINSTFAGHYDLASFLVLILPMIISYLILTKNRIEKLCLFLCYSFGMWLLVNSASRISLASLLGAVTISLLLIKKYTAIPIVIIYSLAFTLFSSNLIGRYERIIDVFKTKISKVAVGEVYAQTVPKNVATVTSTPVPIFEDRSTNIRLKVEWPRAVRAFVKNPVLGTGYSSITLATDNDYLRALGETGILGFLAFAFIFVQLAVNFFKGFGFNYNSLEKAFIVGIIGSIFGIFLNATFIDVFEASKFAIIFWMLVGFSQGIIHGYAK